MQVLTVQVLTRAAFAPFGDVIELSEAQHFPINGGNTERYHDLANVDLYDQGGRPLISVFRGQPRALPFEVKMLERHPLGSQAFIPLGKRPYAVIVAPEGRLDPEGLRAFITQGWQGVNYAKGVWHHPLIALEMVSDFVVVDRGGEGRNLQEQTLREPVWLTREALAAAE
ncbi:MAG: ureidoglycolate lyase [Verrucomicrobia bacterium]|nr:ureidoglycolate lyase [Verrucomicrobiota bacterium]